MGGKRVPGGQGDHARRGLFNEESPALNGAGLRRCTSHIGTGGYRTLDWLILR
jgi:hypothetical protein